MTIENPSAGATITVKIKDRVKGRRGIATATFRAPPQAGALQLGFLIAGDPTAVVLRDDRGRTILPTGLERPR